MTTLLQRGLSALLATAFAVALILPTLIASTPTAEGGWSGHDAVDDRDALAVDWSDVRHPEDFPGCSRRAEGIEDRVVVREDGTAARWTFGEVDAASKRGLRFWVVGGCRIEG